MSEIMSYSPFLYVILQFEYFVVGFFSWDLILDKLPNTFDPSLTFHLCKKEVDKISVFSSHVAVFLEATEHPEF